MNAHTAMSPPLTSSGPSFRDQLRSPVPSLLNAILERLSKPDEPNGVGLIPRRARVVLTPDGAAIRSVLTGRRVMVTGFYNSRKAGRALPYEGMNELALLKHCEVDTSVVDYRSQPLRFEFVIGGVKRTYIADCVRLFADGTLEVVEAKGRLRQLLSPEYAEKLDAVRDACATLGWRFRVLSQRQLFHPAVVYENVEQVQSRRMVRFDQSDAYRALDHIDRLGETSLGRLAELLGAGPRGQAISKAMMVRRLLRIDLGCKLSPDSSVTRIDVGPGVTGGTR